MKNLNTKINSVKELEKKLSIEKLEGRLEMVQLAVMASKASAAAKGNCICGSGNGNGSKPA